MISQYTFILIAKKKSYQISLKSLLHTGYLKAVHISSRDFYNSDNHFYQQLPSSVNKTKNTRNIDNSW